VCFTTFESIVFMLKTMKCLDHNDFSINFYLTKIKTILHTIYNVHNSQSKLKFITILD